MRIFLFSRHFYKDLRKKTAGPEAGFRTSPSRASRKPQEEPGGLNRAADSAQHRARPLIR